MTRSRWFGYACLLLAGFLLLPRALPAQPKLGYVDSKRILAEFKEFTEVQKRQSDFFQEYQKSLQQLEVDERRIKKELDDQALILSDQRRLDMQKELAQVSARRMTFIKEKFGAGGELKQKSDELAQPLMKRIAAIIQRIGAEENFDFIFDLQNMGIVFVRDQSADVTNRVLEELNRGL